MANVFGNFNVLFSISNFLHEVWSLELSDMENKKRINVKMDKSYQQHHTSRLLGITP